MNAQALSLLERAGAAEVEHPGGTLLAHLRRTGDLLASWGARPALATAGLCHALYGTDGFATALAGLERRTEIADAIGAEAEEIVYVYASCDRTTAYRELALEDGLFVDRFTGAHSRPGPGTRRDFAELTAANELDLATVAPGFRADHAAGLLTLFTRWRPLLSEPAWAHCRRVLDATGG
ncbi:DUF6817 domain-containing protein [Streptomyces sp. NBC_00083]|uniref:DUF6817 domain-containing protein n=1 Tax=Streptomyces sp. NBC_00083 TaxID=2975647 RepID=UPI00224E6B28|nr:hypothetical protein [Streptomyces sp. NBC_00083]MCX5384125.1 hypothetical protein [Streptomyces sp. NBC_00083]